MKTDSLSLIAGLACAALMASPACADPVGGETTAIPTGDSAMMKERLLSVGAVRTRAPDSAAIDVFVGSTGIALGLPLHDMPTASSGFGPRSDPLGGGRRRHVGIDFPGSAGSRVLASGSGVVRFAGWAGGYGNMVEIDHGGGLRTRYGHLMQSLVAEGEAIAGGAIVGLMGSTGRSTGTHLHYEVRIGGQPVQPFRGSYRRSTDMSAISAYLPDEVQAAPRWQGWARSQQAGSLPAPVIY